MDQRADLLYVSKIISVDSRESMKDHNRRKRKKKEVENTNRVFEELIPIMQLQCLLAGYELARVPQNNTALQSYIQSNKENR